MRTIIASILLCLPMLMAAQTDWEKPKTDNAPTSSVKATNSEEYKYAKYLEGAVHVKDGEVVWDATFVNDKSASENYDTMLEFLTNMTKEENQTQESCVTLISPNDKKIVAHYVEWLVFSNKLLALDRTEMQYVVECDCYDKKVYVKIFRIRYHYEENRKGGERFQAETWITDKYALNKKKTKLSKYSGKFRRCTVDRMEELLQKFETVIKG
jgi:colicin import membrane protein